MMKWFTIGGRRAGKRTRMREAAVEMKLDAVDRIVLAVQEHWEPQHGKVRFSQVTETDENGRLWLLGCWETDLVWEWFTLRENGRPSSKEMVG